MVAITGGHAGVWTGPERRAVVDHADHPSRQLERVGAGVFRYGLALIFLWAGLLKFTVYEAKNIEPMVLNSPIFAWAYQRP
ncbi:MAG: DUF417 family protein [Rubrivivax sp.]